MKKYKLGDIAALNASTIARKGNIEIEYLDTSNIVEGQIFQTQKICLKDAPSRAQRCVAHNTIIYSLVRPNQRHYGILQNPPENFIVSTGFVTIDLNESFREKVDPYFLFLLLTQNHLTNHLQSIAENSVSSYPSLVPSDLANIEFQIPSVKTQKSIVRLIRNVNQKIDLNRSINHNLVENARHRFLPVHSSGEGEVSRVA